MNRIHQPCPQSATAPASTNTASTALTAQQQGGKYVDHVHPHTHSQRNSQHQLLAQTSNNNDYMAHIGFEDFDDADALMDLLGSTSHDESQNNSAEQNEIHAMMASFSGKDLSSLYESGMMKSVHMEVQENAKIPNLNPTININRDGHGHSQGRPHGFAVQHSEGGRLHSAHGWNGSTNAVPSSLKPPESSRTEQSSHSESKRDSSGGVKLKPLAEKFLGSKSRVSAALAYSNAGQLAASALEKLSDEKATIQQERSAKPAEQNFSDADSVAQNLNHYGSSATNKDTSSNEISNTPHSQSYNVEGEQMFISHDNSNSPRPLSSSATAPNRIHASYGANSSASSIVEKGVGQERIVLQEHSQSTCPSSGVYTSVSRPSGESIEIAHPTRNNFVQSACSASQSYIPPHGIPVEQCRQHHASLPRASPAVHPSETSQTQHQTYVDRSQNNTRFASQYASQGARQPEYCEPLPGEHNPYHQHAFVTSTADTRPHSNYDTGSHSQQHYNYGVQNNAAYSSSRPTLAPDISHSTYPPEFRPSMGTMPQNSQPINTSFSAQPSPPPPGHQQPQQHTYSAPPSSQPITIAMDRSHCAPPTHASPPHRSVSAPPGSHTTLAPKKFPSETMHHNSSTQTLPASQILNSQPHSQITYGHHAHDSPSFSRQNAPTDPYQQRQMQPPLLPPFSSKPEGQNAPTPSASPRNGQHHDPKMGMAFNTHVEHEQGLPAPPARGHHQKPSASFAGIPPSSLSREHADQMPRLSATSPITTSPTVPPSLQCQHAPPAYVHPQMPSPSFAAVPPPSLSKHAHQMPRLSTTPPTTTSPAVLQSQHGQAAPPPACGHSQNSSTSFAAVPPPSLSIQNGDQRPHLLTAPPASASPSVPPSAMPTPHSATSLKVDQNSSGGTKDSRPSMALPGLSSSYQYPRSQQIHSGASAASQRFTASGKTSQFSKSDPPTSVMSKAIQDMASRKSQFGFGGNHMIPSVPLPPSVQQHMQSREKKRSLSGVSNSEEGKLECNKASRTLASASSLPAEPIADVPISGNVAYERKKAKAKQGRVLLNESIDKLAVAINVAGQQSRARLDMLGDMFALDNTREAMRECESIGKNAKKYDRPAFVGAAAAMVQALNDQCEALVEEVRHLKDQNHSADSQTKQSSNSALLIDTAAGSASDKSKASAEVPIGVAVSNSRQESTSLKNVVNREKCARIGTSECPVNFGDADKISCSSLLAQGPVFSTLVSFMDPKSISRCLRVSRSWSSLEEFRGNPVWRQLCVKRFGVSTVEQWENSDFFRRTLSGPHKQMLLYKAMSEANVAPATNEAKLLDRTPIYEQSKLQIGHSTMPGVSAWASMVSRSNGETLRSVKRSAEIRDGKTNSQSTIYSPLPVVELRIVVQNTGIESSVIIPDQPIAVDASTRRRREEYKEVASDERFKKQAIPLKVDSAGIDSERDDEESTKYGLTQSDGEQGTFASNQEKFRLRLFDAVVLVVNIHAKGCCTTSKFLKKANFTKVLVTTNGTTRPMVIPLDDCDKREDELDSSCLVLHQVENKSPQKL